MSHIVKTEMSVVIKDKQVLVRALTIEGLVYSEQTYGYDVKVPGVDESRMSSLRTDEQARVMLKWNDKTQQYDAYGESYSIQTQYNQTVFNIGRGYKFAAMESAMRAIFPMVNMQQAPAGKLRQAQAVSYS